MRLAGKAAIVTGGTRGIGEGIVKEFAAEGCKVIFTGRSAEQGKRVEGDVRAAGGTALFVPCDSADPDGLRLPVDRAVTDFGRLDILINNVVPSDMLRAGGGEGSATVLDPAVFRRIMAVGFESLFWACRHTIPVMDRSGGGSIVNISSAVSVLGTEGMFAYTASKGAMNAVTRQLAVDYAPQHIRCNAIVVGPVEKPGEGQNPSVYDDPAVKRAFETLILTRLGRPRDIAYAALYLASDEAEFVTGSSLTVDGGLTIRSHHPNVTEVDV